MMNGIFVNQGSGALLGADSGTGGGGPTGNTIFTRPNKTTRNNLLFGIRCQVGANADGRLGTLNGNAGQESYVEGCVPSLIP
jgi:hypothetical protein